MLTHIFPHYLYLVYNSINSDQQTPPRPSGQVNEPGKVQKRSSVLLHSESELTINLRSKLTLRASVLAELGGQPLNTSPCPWNNSCCPAGPPASHYSRGRALFAIPDFCISSPQKKVLRLASRPKITDSGAGRELWRSCFRGRLNLYVKLRPTNFTVC